MIKSVSIISGGGGRRGCLDKERRKKSNGSDVWTWWWHAQEIYELVLTLTLKVIHSFNFIIMFFFPCCAEPDLKYRASPSIHHKGPKALTVVYKFGVLSTEALDVRIEPDEYELCYVCFSAYSRVHSSKFMYM